MIMYSMDSLSEENIETIGLLVGQILFASTATVTVFLINNILCTIAVIAAIIIIGFYRESFYDN